MMLDLGLLQRLHCLYADASHGRERVKRESFIYKGTRESRERDMVQILRKKDREKVSDTKLSKDDLLPTYVLMCITMS